VSPMTGIILGPLWPACLHIGWFDVPGFTVLAALAAAGSLSLVRARLDLVHKISILSVKSTDTGREGAGRLAEKLDLVGLSEVAQLAGVSKQAVVNWRSRHGDFP